MKIIKLKISRCILRYMKDIIRKLKEQKFITKVGVSEDNYKDYITQTGDPDEIIKYVESKYESERPEYPITKESNPTLMTIMHGAGLAASEDFMTRDEVEAVTDEQFKLSKSDFTVCPVAQSKLHMMLFVYNHEDLNLSFNELRYFTKLTKLPSFAGTSLKSTIIPKNIIDFSEVNNYYEKQLPYIPRTCQSLNVDNDNPKYDSRDNCNAIIETESNTLIAGTKSTIIPNSVNILGPSAFSYLGITDITIPSSVSEIGEWTFRGCPFNSITLLHKTAPDLDKINISSYITSSTTIKVPKDATGYDVAPWTDYTIERLEE